MIKQYNYLPEEAVKIREEVFIKEQKFNDEFDETDNTAIHLIYYIDDTAVATCRFFHDKIKNEYAIGRIAVLPAYRGMHIGADIVREAERIIKDSGGKKINISAQARLSEFYSKLGYIPTSEAYIDEATPNEEYKAHICLGKEL